MRMSKTHKVAVTAVVTTIATATVLTFTRADTAPAEDIASLPRAAGDSPAVAQRRPAAETKESKPSSKPKPKPSATTPAPKADDPATQAPRPAATTDKPTPTTQPTPSPAGSTPTPHQKTLLEILLGQ